MEYSKIVAVTGLPGLFELINSRNDGAIVKSLEDGKTKFISARLHNFSHLESIEVYTIKENVNLVEIFGAMEKAGQSLPDTKDDAAVKNYFKKVYPDMDFERVYSSDLKKMIKWFEILKTHNIEIKLTIPEEEPEAEPAPPSSEEEKPKKETKKKEPAEKEEKKADKKPAKATSKDKEKTASKKSAKKK